MIVQSSQTWNNTHTSWNTTGITYAGGYENIAFDRIMDNLNQVLRTEFNIPVRYDKHYGNQSFLITLIEDSLSETFTIGQVREYVFNIEYKVLSSGRYHKNNIQQISNTVERVKRLIFNNTNKLNSWHHGRIETTSIDRVNNAMLSTLQFNCLYDEVSSN